QALGMPNRLPRVLHRRFTPRCPRQRVYMAAEKMRACERRKKRRFRISGNRGKAKESGQLRLPEHRKSERVNPVSVSRRVAGFVERPAKVVAGILDVAPRDIPVVAVEVLQLSRSPADRITPLRQGSQQVLVGTVRGGFA